jgi:hypothetical protein
MTSKHARRGQKKRRQLVSVALPPEVQMEASPGLIRIVEDYLKVLVTLPVDKYGADDLEERFDFAIQITDEFMQSGPAILGDVTVKQILAVAFAGEELTVTFKDNFYKGLRAVVEEGLGVGMCKFLQALERAITELPDEALAGFALDGMSADTFRTLADQFAGTFDELVEVARNL